MGIRTKIILINLLLLLFFSCNENSNVNKELGDNFNDNQVKDFDTILIFFKNQACNGSESFKNCIENIVKKSNTEGSKYLSNTFDYSEQEKLYDNINRSTFNAIWLFCKTSNPEKNISYESLCFNNKGGYESYLKQLSTKSNFHKSYYEDITNSGDFSPEWKFAQNIVSNKDNFDFSDYNNQLIIAIHYLSLSDQHQRE